MPTEVPVSVQDLGAASQLRTNVHERKAQQVQSTPFERVFDVFMVCRKTDASNLVYWARFHENPLARGDQELSKIWMLRELCEVAGDHDGASVTFPNALVEAAYGSSQGFGRPRIGCIENVRCRFLVVEELRFGMHHEVFCSWET